MQKLPEAAIAKVNELIAALHYAADDLKIIGQEAMLSGDFAQVTESMDACKKLQVLETNIQTAIRHFQSQYPTRLTEEKNNSNKHGKKITRKRSDGYLRVSVAGRAIEETTIKETFIETLKALGLERVAKLNKVVAKTPLVSRMKANGYQTQRQCDGWYITTHVNKVTAKAMLQDIAKALNEPLKVECIER